MVYGRSATGNQKRQHEPIDETVTLDSMVEICVPSVKWLQ